MNRYYRPLGLGAWDDWRGDYEAYADHAVHFSINPHALVGAWCSDNGHTLYLYNGDPASLKSYYQRFARFAAAMCPWRTQGEAPAPEGA